MTIRTNIDFAKEDAATDTATVPSDPNIERETTGTAPAGDLDADATANADSADSLKSDENNIDFNEFFSDNTEDKEGQTDTDSEPANSQEKEEEFLKGINTYSTTTIERIFNGNDLQDALKSGEPEKVIKSIQSLFVKMYEQTIQDAMLVSRKFASDAMNTAQANQLEREAVMAQQNTFAKGLEKYPVLQEKRYKPIVDAIYAKAIAQKKSPAEAAKYVISYFRKNIPNTIVEPTKTKQTDGVSINDDIWAKYNR